MTKFQRFLSDFWKIGFLMGVVGYGLWLVDPANSVIFQATGIGLFIVGGTHLTRRILFSKLDLQAIANKAIDDRNMAAAIVFAAVMLFLIAVVFIPMQVIK